MSESQQVREAMFFGAVEAVCFGGLFLSPVVTEASLRDLWLLTAAFRVISLVLCLGLTARPGQSLALTAGCVGRGMLYQIPFWTSALVFPLRQNQSQLALEALLWEVGFMLILLPLPRMSRRWMLPVLYVSSWIWLYGHVLEQGRAWVYLAFGSLTLWPGFAGPAPRILDGNRYLQAFGASLLWLACLGLTPLAEGTHRQGMLTLLLPWCLVCLVGIGVFDLARRMTARRTQQEAEASLPEFCEGLGWLVRRRARFFGALIPLLALATSSGRDLLVWLLVLTACQRALMLVSRGRSSPEVLAWWASWEFTMLWGASRTGDSLAWAWLGVAALSSWMISRGRALAIESFQEPLNLRLGEGLRRGLLVPAPEGFAGQVTARLEPSVDLDEELVAIAPAGFRQRLLERLQSGEAEEE